MKFTQMSDQSLFTYSLICIRKFFYYLHKLSKILETDISYLTRENIQKEEGIILYQDFKKCIEEVEDVFVKIDSFKRGTNINTKEIERLKFFWFYPFLVSLSEEIKEEIMWLGIGSVEFDINGELTDQHWLYFCDKTNFNNVRTAFSVIGPSSYREILKNNLILSYPLMQKLKQRDPDLGCCFFIPLKKEIQKVLQQNLFPFDFFMIHIGDWNNLQNLKDIKFNENYIQCNENEKILEDKLIKEFIKKDQYCSDIEKFFQNNQVINKNIKVLSFKKSQNSPEEFLLKEIEKNEKNIEKKFLNYLQLMKLSTNEQGDLIVTIPGELILNYEKIRGLVTVICFKITNNTGNTGNKTGDEKIKNKLLENVLFFINRIYSLSSYFSFYTLEFYHKKTFYYSLRSAITTIMSRNMSHNIGSHVLSYLILGGVEKNASRITYEDNSDCESRQDNIKKFYNVLKGLCDNLTKLEPNEFFINSLKEIKNLLNFPRWGLVEWVEDVRVFMQYLQHRMDFLANISTEWPKWTFPAWLMKDIMHYFLKQRALLDGIGRSEGLKGYYYGYKVCCLDLSEEKPIKIHVVKIKKEAKEIWQGKIKKSWDDRNKDYNNSSKVVLLLKSTKNPTVNLKDDICIAIPGGIVGYQAFFVILENVIRNAAKHSFIKKKPKALEIIIEVIDDPDKPDEEWRFRIYDNVSSSVEKCNCRGPVINDKGEREEDCLVTYMNKILRQPIIKKTGEIHRSNWGMAEMKIAATYLQQRDISVLGESGDKITGGIDGGGDFVIRAICSPIGTLGYEFKMLKPKDAGIVCKREEVQIGEKDDTN